MPVTAADIPIELHDLILSFFELDEEDDNDNKQEDDKHVIMKEEAVAEEDTEGEEEDEEKGEEEDENKEDDYSDERNFVFANKRELGWLTLVCRRWARLCQPRIFQEVTLQNRDDTESLLALLAYPKCRIAEYIQKVELCQSVTTYPYPPWIHIVVIQLIPQLRLFQEMKPMILAGPLPPGQSVSSIHGVLPTRYPFFATGIRWLVLRDLHVKSFEQLVRMLKELPSLEEVQCHNVTWNNSPDAPLPAATSYAGRVTDREVWYEMSGCTDNTAAMWLSWLLAPTLTWRLEQQDSDALCRIASALTKNVDTARSPEWTVVSDRGEGFFWFWALENGTRLTPDMYVYLTPAVPGERTRRRVRAITFAFRYINVWSMVGWDCWPAIDAQLAGLPSLHTVVLQFKYSGHDDLVLFANNVVTQKMPALRDSDKLKYAHFFGGGCLWFTHNMINSNEKGRWIRYLDDIL